MNTTLRVVCCLFLFTACASPPTEAARSLLEPADASVACMPDAAPPDAAVPACVVVDAAPVACVVVDAAPVACVPAPDAAPLPDAAAVPCVPPPDAAPVACIPPPDAGVSLVHRRTAGLLIGDSIVFRLGNAVFPLLTANGVDTVYSIAQNGATVDAERTLYETGIYPNINLDYIFVMVAVNDVLANESAATIEGKLATLVSSIQTRNPEAVLIVSEMLPARTTFDAKNPAFYSVWLEVNSWLRTTYGAVTTLSDALNDGSGHQLMTVDGTHPNTAGNNLIGGILRNLVLTTFPNVPCTCN